MELTTKNVLSIHLVVQLNHSLVMIQMLMAFYLECIRMVRMSTQALVISQRAGGRKMVKLSTLIKNYPKIILSFQKVLVEFSHNSLMDWNQELIKFVVALLKDMTLTIQDTSMTIQI